MSRKKPIAVDVVLSDSYIRREPPKPQEYPLRGAVFFYGDTSQQIATICNVTAGKLGVARAIDPIELARSIYRLKQGEQTEPLFFCEGNILAENREVVWWWLPACQRPMWFKTVEPTQQLTALNGKSVTHPPLLFRVIKRGTGALTVWAMLENDRPTLNTELYHAPYMNRYADGSICLGSARDRSLTDMKKAGPRDWEGIFFDSNFSHTAPPLNYGKASKKPIDPAADLGSEAAQRNERLVAYASFLQETRSLKPWSSACRAFFARSLVPANTTLGKRLNSSVQD